MQFMLPTGRSRCAQHSADMTAGLQTLETRPACLLTLVYLEYDMSQLTEGKCLRCASFLSKPQNTCRRVARGFHRLMCLC